MFFSSRGFVKLAACLERMTNEIVSCSHFIFGVLFNFLRMGWVDVLKLEQFLALNRQLELKRKKVYTY